MVPPTSLFAQVLKLVDWTAFERGVRSLQAEKHAKGFGCWDQFVSMFFCQMGAAHSLSEICGGPRTALGKLSHLGPSAAPAKSTLSYATTVRPRELYRLVFDRLLSKCQNLAAMLRMNLMSYRDLWAWLDAPFHVPLVEPTEKQMELIAK